MTNGYPDAGEYLLELRLHGREWVLWLEVALSSARQLNDRREEGNHLGNLGSAYYALGETRRAIEHYEQALVTSREIGNRRGEGSVLGSLGIVYADLGEIRSGRYELIYVDPDGKRHPLGVLDIP